MKLTLKWLKLVCFSLNKAGTKFYVAIILSSRFYFYLSLYIFLYFDSFQALSLIEKKKIDNIELNWN